MDPTPNPREAHGWLLSTSSLANKATVHLRISTVKLLERLHSHDNRILVDSAHTLLANEHKLLISVSC